MLMKMSPWQVTDEELGEKTAIGALLPGQSGDFNIAKKDELIEKASTLAAQNTAGASEGSFLWIRVQAGNPFFDWIHVEAAGKVNHIRLPELRNEPALRHNTVDPAHAGTAGQIPDAGDVIDFEIQYYENSLRASLSAVEDLPDFEEAYAALATEQLFTQSGKNIFDQLKQNSDIQSQTTGVATGLPTNANVKDKLGELIERLPGQYHRFASLHVSPSLWRVLNAASDSHLDGYAWQGIPLVVNGQLDSGNAAGDVSAIFGDLWYGYFFAIRKEVAIRQYNNNGIPWFHASARFGGAVWNPDAIGKLVTGA